MPRILLAALALIALAPGLARAGFLGLNPYCRFAWIQSQIEVPTVNQGIHDDEAALEESGFGDVTFSEVPNANGFQGVAGLWLFPGFRLGAVYSQQTSNRMNKIHPVGYFFADELNFRFQEIGGEALIRIRPLWGLSLGGEVLQTRAEFTEGRTWQDFYAMSNSFFDGKARRTLTTYAAFIGLDQTNEAGYVGYIRAGYRFRDMGEMPATAQWSDGSTTVNWETSTVPLDMSGWFITLGTGFDLKH